MIKEYLPNFVEKYKIDFVIANAENATHGKGLSQNHYFELIDAGIDVITLGNHYLSKRELLITLIKLIDLLDLQIYCKNLVEKGALFLMLME